MQLSVKSLALAKEHLKHVIDLQKFHTHSSDCFVEVGSVSQAHPGMTRSLSAEEEGAYHICHKEVVQISLSTQY